MKIKNITLGRVDNSSPDPADKPRDDVDGSNCQQTLVIKNKNIQRLFVLYLISNLLLLLNINGIYWDDWGIYNQSFAEIKILADQLTGKAHLFEYIFWGLGQIGNGIFPYRIVTFIVYFLSGLFLYFILLDIKDKPDNVAFYVTLLFLLVPVNNARIGLCVVHYGVFQCLFFMSFWLLTRYINNQGGLLFRLAILSLFYLSFFVNSLIVFYAIVLIYMMHKIYMNSTEKSWIGSLKILFVKYPDFICLPILFFYIKTRYYVPYGLYENYNALSLNVWTLAANITEAFKTSFYKPLSQSFIISARFLFLSVTTVVFLFLYLPPEHSHTPVKTPRREVIKPLLIMLCLGLLFFVLAIFPYVAVGKIPSLASFNSRNMLLVPLGLSLCLYSGVLFIKQKNSAVAHVVLITLLASFIVKNIHDQSQYLKDWFYQVAMEEHYKDSKQIKEHSTFFYRTNIAFAHKRSMQFYEHNGRLRKVFGDDRRFMGDNLHEIETYANFHVYKRYNFSSWTMTSPVVVTIQKDLNHDITKKPFIWLLFSMLTDDITFRSEAKKLIKMDLYET